MVAQSSEPVVTYDFNGTRHIRQGHRFRVVAGEELHVFEILRELEKQGRWAEICLLCESQIQKTPEWLTPYLCAGVAYANLDEPKKAMRKLELVEKMAGGNQDYAAAARILNELRREAAPPKPEE